jgi:hypothetical protein
MYPGVGVGNGIAGLGAKTAIGPPLFDARTGDIQFGANRIVKKMSVRSNRLFTVQPSMFSSTEAFKPTLEQILIKCLDARRSARSSSSL